MRAPGEILARYRRALGVRDQWLTHWHECYEFALPQRQVIYRQTRGARRFDRVFDGTAPDAVEQLAASMLSELTPPWQRWFALQPLGLTEDERAGAEDVAKEVEAIGSAVHAAFDSSNFTVEIHQCYLDLITAGTASLAFREGLDGDAAFQFRALPLSEVVLEEGDGGRLDVTFRRFEWTVGEIKRRFPQATIPDELTRRQPERRADDVKLGVLEACMPDGEGRFEYQVLALPAEAGDPAALAGGAREAPAGGDAARIHAETLELSPFINFRWLKAPGETYGRGPVMKALPDIKTANKTVELVLKNASIAVTGIWQADDDGVLNPATIKLVPGAIIPKAVGSNGLAPLAAPGRFDVSQLVLDDLRKRIRHALLVDRLAQIDTPRMTATEVLERSAEMARLLAATYGRLQSELLTPLVDRGLAILAGRGAVTLPRIDADRTVELTYLSPLARQQRAADVRNLMMWVQAAAGLGGRAAMTVDDEAVARVLARMLGVPAEVVRDKDAVAQAQQQAQAAAAAAAMAEAAAGGGGGGPADDLAGMLGQAAE